MGWGAGGLGRMCMGGYCLQNCRCGALLELSAEEGSTLGPPFKCPGWGRLFECGSDAAVAVTNGFYLFSSSGKRKAWIPCPMGPSGDQVLALGQFCTMSTLNI